MIAPLYVLLGIAAIILASGISRSISARAQRDAPPNGDLTGIDARLAALERHLGDIQEIVLAADEKLERLEERLVTKPLQD